MLLIVVFFPRFPLEKILVSMSARPRPVTATVTKPLWMLVPDADSVVNQRKSYSSDGSTASLTSILDHDSYISEPELSDEKLNLTEQQEVVKKLNKRERKSIQSVKQRR